MGIVQRCAPFYTPPICRSARNAAFRRRFRGKRGLRKPQRPPTRGRGSREAADKPLQEAGAFEMFFFFAQTRRLSISPPPLPPRQTPSFSRAAQSAHLRGAPHTASPYAGGGVAAASCRPAPKRAGRRAALPLPPPSNKKAPAKRKPLLCSEPYIISASFPTSQPLLS